MVIFVRYIWWRKCWPKFCVKNNISGRPQEEISSWNPYSVLARVRHHEELSSRDLSSAEQSVILLNLLRQDLGRATGEFKRRISELDTEIRHLQHEPVFGDEHYPRDVCPFVEGPGGPPSMDEDEVLDERLADTTGECAASFLAATASQCSGMVDHTSSGEIG